MMDIALLTANASQLRYIMRSPYWDVYHQANVILISISLALQVTFFSSHNFLLMIIDSDAGCSRGDPDSHRPL